MNVFIFLADWKSKQNYLFLFQFYIPRIKIKIKPPEPISGRFEVRFQFGS